MKFLLHYLQDFRCELRERRELVYSFESNMKTEAVLMESGWLLRVLRVLTIRAKVSTKSG